MSRADGVHPIIPDWPAPERVRAASSTRTSRSTANSPVPFRCPCAGLLWRFL